jgi:hypothetical protein
MPQFYFHDLSGLPIPNSAMKIAIINHFAQATDSLTESLRKMAAFQKFFIYRITLDVAKVLYLTAIRN